MIRPTVPSGCTSRRVLAAAALAIAVFGLGAPARAATFIVNDTTDAVDAAPGDGVCLTAAGQCTLRAAIRQANALAGPDTIVVPAGTVVLTLVGTGEDAAVTGDLDIMATWSSRVPAPARPSWTGAGSTVSSTSWPGRSRSPASPSATARRPSAQTGAASGIRGP